MISLILACGKDSLSNRIGPGKAVCRLLLLTLSVIGISANIAVGQFPLHRAADAGDAELLKKHLKDGCDVNQQNKYGETPLELARNAECAKLIIDAGCDMKLPANRKFAVLAAAKYGTPEHVKILLDAGCDLDGLNNDKRTPLILAAQFNKASVVRLLCERGANLNATDRYGISALGWAAWSSQSSDDAVDVLIKAGAKVNLADSRGRTPLFYATQRSAAKTRSLLKAGADTSFLKWNALMIAVVSLDEAGVKKEIKRRGKICLKDRDANQMTPLHLAAYFGNKQIIELLSKSGADHTATESSGFSPLVIAAIMGTAEQTQAMISNGSDPNQLDRRGFPVLLHCDDYQIAKVLIDAGANVNERGKSPLPPLFKFLGYGSVFGPKNDNQKILKLLIDAGANLSASIEHLDTKNVNALMYAVDRRASTKAINLLLENGVDITAVDEDGKSVLHYAVNGSTPTLLKMLIEKGAPLEAADGFGHTALDQAVSIGKLNLVRELVQAGAKVKKSILSYCGTLELLEFFVQNGAKPNYRDEHGRNALFPAIRFDKLEVVKFLLEKGCDPNAKDEFGLTPMILAVSEGKPAKLELLIKHGADTDVRNGQKETLVDIASQLTDKRTRQELLELLAKAKKK